MALMTQVGFDTNLWWMRLLMFTMGLSMAQVIVSTQAASFATISHADTGTPPRCSTASASWAAPLGVAAADHGPRRRRAPPTWWPGTPCANLTAYHAAFLAAAGIALVASAMALTINDADAAATMVRRGKPKAETETETEDPSAGTRLVTRRLSSPAPR